MEDIIWQNTTDKIVLSPRWGGRVISWEHHAAGQLVQPPLNLDGGLLRVLLGEERYPGTSYLTPHIVVAHKINDKGFTVHLRHFWNAQNAYARLFGWQDKVNMLITDGLLLDKTVKFDAEKSALIVRVRITNVSARRVIITPWMQNTFSSDFENAFVCENGARKPFVWMDLYWEGHRVESASNVRLVGEHRNLRNFAVLGCVDGSLAGFAAYTPKLAGEKLLNAALEFRFKSISLNPGESWQTDTFTLITENWQKWAENVPALLACDTESPKTSEWNGESLIPLLFEWALPEERKAGFMIISHLDKLPFSSSHRFSSIPAFAGFCRKKDRAQSSVILLSLAPSLSVSARLSSPAGWFLIDREGNRCTEFAYTLRQFEFMQILLEGPAALTGKKDAKLSLLLKNGNENSHVTVRIIPDAVAQPQFKYQVKQISAYLDERFRKEKTGFHGNSRKEFFIWQKKERRRHLDWLRASITKPCLLLPRLMERQVGPACIRDKVLVQTEPGLWIPAYVVYPKNRREKMPAVIFFHGSGPGKQAFVADESENFQRSEPGHELEMIPYRLAKECGYLVYCPDQRGWGEWSEANHAQQPQRAYRAGYNMLAMMMWDHMRSIDYLCSRPDVDRKRIGCFGASGGGLATIYTAGIDERVSAAIISSSIVFPPQLPEDYFFRFMEDPNAVVFPEPSMPTAPVYTCALTIPRPLWVMDGKNDLCDANLTTQDSETIERNLSIWRAKAQSARDELARLYALAGAPENFRSSWFDGGHCAGMTFANVSEWFRKWWG